MIRPGTLRNAHFIQDQTVLLFASEAATGRHKECFHILPVPFQRVRQILAASYCQHFCLAYSFMLCYLAVARNA